ncbi:hypothetical protein VZ94_15215 [Methylocucumis oryzae]|uniref:Aminoacyl-transfer RNA synthetases class-II family profile domain-containing protein n=1 Tax=Methylocucumis oryzae TaxID=1632867 RepID=A0A0F3IJV6_9GAMM|nr:EF-P lysine aminoacylase EpmA [Methylocucumis oryzae]KJV05839.1 hypothetical protein VZ94_15215 [Methylocucumis oryzae]
MSVLWQPACELDALRLRAQLLQAIRQFFQQRGVLEVETPLLCQAVATDPQLDFFTTRFHLTPHQQTLYLQTSPEFAMKRLLAAGSGCIFQICKAFRNGETGRMHNPEFTLLEWYRVGFDLAALMDEVAELLLTLLAPVGITHCERISYVNVFVEHTGLNPLVFDSEAYHAYVNSHGFADASTLCGENHALWLDFLFSHCVQPLLGLGQVTLVYGYPALQSSLARLNSDDARVTERVEVFVSGVELGNGYEELTDAVEQERRFNHEVAARQQQGLAPVIKDQRLLAALQSGLPACSGIAIGVDRLLMLVSGLSHIDAVLAFPIARA